MNAPHNIKHMHVGQIAKYITVSSKCSGKINYLLNILKIIKHSQTLIKELSSI